MVSESIVPHIVAGLTGLGGYIVIMNRVESKVKEESSEIREESLDEVEDSENFGVEIYEKLRKNYDRRKRLHAVKETLRYTIFLVIFAFVLYSISAYFGRPLNQLVYLIIIGVLVVLSIFSFIEHKY